MNDLVADEAHNLFGNDFPFIGFNDIFTDKTYVFNSDSLPVLSAFSPTWYAPGTYGPGGKQNHKDCGVLSTYKSLNVGIGKWAETHCESGSDRRSICE